MSQAYSNLKYTADPYGYTRRLTDVLSLGSLKIGGENPICIQGILTANPLDNITILGQVIQYAKMSYNILRVNVPSIQVATNFAKIKNQLRNYDYNITFIANVKDNLEIGIEALEWADGLQIAATLLNQTDEQNYFDALVRKANTLERTFEIYNIGTSGTSEPSKLVDPILHLTKLLQEFDFQNFSFSLKVTNCIACVKAYRWLTAQLISLGWKYPIHLTWEETRTSKVERMRTTLVLGALLEDGIGDSLSISLGGQPRREVELAYRIARRYTPLNWAKPPISVTELEETEDHLTDKPPVVVATDRANWRSLLIKMTDPYDRYAHILTKSNEYPYVITKLPDYRQPYEYSRRLSKEVQIGSIKIGGSHSIARIGRLSGKKVRQLLNKAYQAEQLDNPSFQPDIYIANFLTPKVLQLRETGLLKTPLIVGVTTPQQAKKALAARVEGITICLDTVGQIGQELEELELIAEVLKSTNIPILIISTHNAGQSWGAYDYWPSFSEARQLITAVEVCQKYGLTELLLGIYTYNSAWNTQNYRLLMALMYEQGWNYPIHLTAPDLLDPMSIEEEYRIDAGISLGGILIDGIGDSVQTDYLSKDEDRFPKEVNFKSIKNETLQRLATTLLWAFASSNVSSND